MKILTLHSDYIKFKAGKKALKSLDIEDKKEEKHVKDSLVVFTAVEKGDTEDQIKSLVTEVTKIAKQVNVDNIVLYPYAHLSSNLGDPKSSLEMFNKTFKELKKVFKKVEKAPFGFYKEFEIKVKGHPLAELSRSFNNDGKESVAEEYDPKQLLREISKNKLDTSKLKPNDHRILGQKLDLFSFSEVSPGSVFWHHNGYIIYKELINFMREILQKYDYQEISTPEIMDNKIWKISGHWEHYKDNMFLTNYEKRDLGVKPMSCPGGMLVYRNSPKSYKDLPLRAAEFGLVHRQELSGVLAGLFRVIRITQDDGHIFCTKQELEKEIKSILEIIDLVYNKTFNFKYSIELSTRPKKFMGDKKDWDYAEKILENVLKKSKIKFKINKGDGAFYGPKIDFHIKDSLNRSWQCGTIQLDTQLPERFNIKYIDKDNKEKTPLMLHRTILGSIERFIGILLEDKNGALPTWLSPTQVRIINFTDRNNKYGEKIMKEIKKEIPGIRIDTDFDSVPLGGKIRDAMMMKIPYVIVVGDKEEKENKVAVRKLGSKNIESMETTKFINQIKSEIDNRK